MIQKITNTKEAAPLFQNWNETLIWSCLQGVMGSIYADRQTRPGSAAAVLGDFCFFAGQVSRELILFVADILSPEFIIMVPQDEPWQKSISHMLQKRAIPRTRYATQKEDGVFDRPKLKIILNSLPAAYTLHSIDESLYRQCRLQPFSRDLVSQFPDWDTYRKYGLGMAVLKEGEIVSGASSYSRYREGIEIEIDTHMDYRRQGLAAACGAALILACLDRKLYPSWDAQNPASMALAEKLGYRFSHSYPVFEVFSQPTL